VQWGITWTKVTMRSKSDKPATARSVDHTSRISSPALMSYCEPNIGFSSKYLYLALRESRCIATSKHVPVFTRSSNSMQVLGFDYISTLELSYASKSFPYIAVPMLIHRFQNLFSLKISVYPPYSNNKEQTPWRSLAYCLSPWLRYSVT
jgi:hypothetical protein